MDLGAPEGGLGDPAEVMPNKEFSRRPTIICALYFNRKLYKIYYDPWGNSPLKISGMTLKNF